MFKKLPPSISIPLFYVLTSLAILYRFLFSNLFGIFLTCLSFYFLSSQIFEVKPYNFLQLINWFSEQSESTKSALLGAIVTVIGFLIAYASATSNWKSQMLAELKLQAANDIESFFSVAGKLATDCQIYADALVEAVNLIQNGCDTDKATFLAAYNREQGQKFLQNRQQLVSMGIESHRFQGKYSMILVSAPGLMPDMLSAINCLNKITEKVWFHVPYFIESDTNPVQSFINQVNVSKCIEFSRAVNDNIAQVHFASGGVKGHLQSSIIPFTFWSLLFLYREKQMFKDAVENSHNHGKKL